MIVKKKNIKVIRIFFILFLFLIGHQVFAQTGTAVSDDAIVAKSASSSISSSTGELLAGSEKSTKEKDAHVTKEVESLAVQDKGTSTEQETEKIDVVKEKIEVSPSVIDEKFLKSEIGKYSIKLKNNTDRKLDIYAMVNNISASEGKLEFSTVNSKERAVSAANWILIKRGVIELMPFAEVSVPLEIRVSQNAVPGKYYVAVSFPNGPNRAGAKESMLNNSYAETLINITVGDNAIEKAQIKKFVTSRSLYLNKEINFNFSIENIGNRTVDPHGFIYITNRKGSEVAKIEIPEGENNLGPGKISEIRKNWLDGANLGKYKAKLELEYGKKTARDLQDTIFFWVLPWQSLLIFISLAIVLVVLLTFIIFKKTYRKEIIKKVPEP